jgi:glycosyltransferase involved in cell wall biosynthesis
MVEFLIFISAHFPGKSLLETIRRLPPQSCGQWRCRILIKGDDYDRIRIRIAEEIGDSRVIVSRSDSVSDSEALNRAVRNAEARHILLLLEGALLEPDCLERIKARFEQNEEAAAVFTSYKMERPDTALRTVRLHPYVGHFHERFSFGFIKAYRTNMLREVGGFRTDLTYASEFDADLKLGDRYTHELIDEPLYTVRYLNSAGLLLNLRRREPLTKYGGSSYLFYPPLVEREMTETFEAMLRRRGAWLDGESALVPCPDRSYPVRATVVIPVINRVQYIAKAISSVQDGEFPDFELIAVDNGSRDGTQDVVRRLAKKDSRIRLIQSAGTIASALNIGIRAAGGKYIFHLDSDDEYTPPTIRTAIAYLESHPRCGLVSSHYVLMDADGNDFQNIPPITHDVYSRNQLLRHEGIGQIRAMPKVVLEEMGGYDERLGSYGEDYDMALRISEVYEIGRMPEVLYRCRRHPGNTEHVFDPALMSGNKAAIRLNALKRRQALNHTRRRSI